MNKLIYFTLCLLALVSCTNNKEYKYVEVVNEPDLFGGSSIKEKDPEIISAPSDSAAYLKAFEKYCISLNVHQQMIKDGMGTYLDTPMRFKLIDPSGIDIAMTVSFANKEEREQEIANKIMALGDISSATKTETVAKIDSAKIKELLPFFEVKKDEFDPNGKIWYTPKSAPKYTNRNGIYCYFMVQNDKPGPLRFRVQYYADDWLFFSAIQFSIDDNAYQFTPLNTETDCGDGGKIWEWFDEALSPSDKDLIYALSEAKSAKMKFLGKQYYDIKTISKAQVTDIKRALDLYHAMGGSY